MNVDDIKKYLSDQFHLPLDQVEAMMPSFIATLDSHMENLEEALGDNDLNEIGKAGHTIKGAFLNLGLKECARIALDIEESGKAGNSGVDYRSKVDSLHRCLEPVFK
jgi:HPt (histidine-containing phosphotransfer) domain-containing protein